MPAAPGLLSTTTGWPHFSDSFCAIQRAPVSVPPPGGKGTTMVTDFVGNASCADAMRAGSRGHHGKRDACELHRFLLLD